MLRCREIAEVVADTKRLPWWRQPEVWMHLAVCKGCRLFASQMTIIRTTAKNVGQKNIDLVKEKELTDKVLEKTSKTFEPR